MERSNLDTAAARFLTDRPAAGAGLLHERFEAQAARMPEAIAVVDGRQSLTYGDLERRANQWAGRLRECGVGPEARVGLCLERSVDLVVCILAVLKAGGAYVPLDPAYPPPRLALLVADSDPAVLITQESLLPLLPEEGCRRLLIDDLAAGVPAGAPGAAPRPPLAATDQNLAYLIYTSGSTGRPKAVAITHRNAAAFVRWALGVFPPADLAGVLASTSVCFDLSIFELFVPLAAGGTVIVVPSALHLAMMPPLPPGLAVTLINTVPSACAELLRQGAVPPTVRVINLAGEALPGALVDRAYRTTAVERVFNLYGPSEDTTYSTYALVDRDQAALAEPSIGRPIEGGWAHLLDDHGRAVGPGEVGEVYLGGEGLSRGYLGRPDLTAERFLPDPHATVPGARVYRTGDLARREAGGDLHFLGRADSQVKVRGFRIELGEVEAVLARHPAVREVAAAACDDHAGGRMLVAYVVSEGPAPGDRELRDFMLGRLPAHLAPSLFELLEALPRTPNGKVDRRALPAPRRAGGEGAATFTPPRNELERQIAGLWCEALGVAAVGVHDPFFTLGGHSLTAMRMLSRLRVRLGVQLQPADLFAAPTVAALARAVEAALAAVAAGAPAAAPLVRGPRRASYPLSSSQLGVWVADKMAAGLPLFNVASVTALTGELNVAALAAALAAVARRHQALRTRLPDHDGEVVQEVLAPPAPRLPLCDLAGLPPRRRLPEAERLEAALARRTFDLAREARPRHLLLRLGPLDHRLVFVVHHIVFDGVSGGVLWHDLSVFYRMATGGPPAPDPAASSLAALPIEYFDFVAWQLALAADPATAAKVAWWRERLAGLTPLELPTDRPRPAARSFSGGSLSWTLAAPLSDALREAARRRGATPLMALLAAYAALLSRVSGQDDLAIGVPSAGRLRAELDGLVGLITNNLVLRVHLGGRPGFDTLIDQVRETALAAYARQEVPFELVVASLNPDRDASRSTLFETLFQLVDRIHPLPSLPGARAATSTVHTGTSKDDIDFELEDCDGTIHGDVEYAKDIFDASSIERLLGHYGELLAAALAEPRRPLADLPLFTPAQRAALLGWSRPPAPAAPPDAGRAALLHELVWEQAARQPEAVAVEAEGASLSYGDLTARARGLAARLRSLGVGPEVVVGVGGEPSPALVVAMLGVLEAGGAMLPLDSEVPAERRAFMLEDAAAALLVAAPAVMAELLPRLALRAAAPAMDAGTLAPAFTLIAPPGEQLAIAVLDRDAAAASPAAPPDTESLAYVLYTSGTSGRPKGVAVPHRAVVQRMLRVSEMFSLGPGDAMVQKASLGFDVALSEIFLPLVAGGRTVLTSLRDRRDPVHLARLCEVQRTSFSRVVPQALEILLDVVPQALESLLDAGFGSARPPVRQVFVGGDMLPAAVRDRLLALGIPLANAYGLTETAIDTVWHLCRLGASAAAAGDAGRRAAMVPIGRPLAGCAAYVLEPSGDLAPVGVPGELFLGGRCLARCYVGLPHLTAQVFVPDPFAAPGEGGARLFRTGDRCRWLPAGDLEFLGRLDSQVKIRGVRVEPAEIEASLLSSPVVRAAAVVARRESGGYRLVAGVVPVAAAAADAGELRAFLQARLPEAMVPAEVVLLDALPLTPNGKVDRRALAALGSAAPRAASERRAPATPIEGVVAEVFAAVLGVPAEEIGAADSFFDIGGHSLLGSRVLSRLRAALGVELPMRRLFAAPTVAALAAAIEESLSGARTAALPPLGRARRAAGARVPLSLLQQGLWFLDRLAPASPLYNIPRAFALHGPLEPAALAWSLGEVVRRHEVLRTRLVEVDGVPWQEIQAVAAPRLPLVDLTGLGAARAARELARLTAAEACRPFDLGRAPLLRATLLRMVHPAGGPAAEVWHALLLTVHHIVADGWSEGVLRAELAAHYEAAVGGRRLALPELPVQYADYTLWQRSWPPQLLPAHLAYWRGRLTGAPMTLALATDRPPLPVQSFRGNTQEAVLPAELAARLRRAARRQGATLYMVLLGGFAALLARHGGADDLLVGTPVANRPRPELEGLIGCFVNTLALRVRLAGDPDFHTLLAGVRDGVLEDFAHQDLPFEAVVEDLQPERDLARNPLVQVMLALQGAWVPPAGALCLQPLPAPAGTTSKFDLSLFVTELAGEEALALTLEHATDLFGGPTARRLLAHYQALLAAAMESPDCRLSRLPLLDAAERHQLLVEWNDTETAFPRRSVHRLFEEQAAVRPDAVAVAWEGGSLTYGELDRRASRVARALRRLGVGAEGRVGVWAERSPGTIAALVGILKAGAAYLPLDPAQPPERFALLMADAAPAAVVGVRRLLARLPAGVPRLALEELEGPPGVGGAEDAAEPGTEVPPAALAHVMYTSGSTGVPKGIELSHEGVVRLVRDTDYAAFGPHSVLLQLANMAFDAATLEIWGPLLNGGRLALFPPRPYSLAELFAAVESCGVTTLFLTTALFHVAVEEGIAGLGSLRRLIFGGEALSRGHAERALAALPGVELLHAYGPTENTTLSTTCVLRSAGPGGGLASDAFRGAGAAAPIGRPIGASRVHVLDERLDLVPLGVVGEGCLGGDGLARGYLHRPDLTAERFVPDPAGPAGARMYRSGDLVRWRADGRLDFVGRRDFQVKVRGFRVELGEVESALRAARG